MSFYACTYVWETSKQKGTHLLALLALAEYANKDTGECYPSIPSLAKMLRMSERNVQMILKKLEEQKAIKIQKFAGLATGTGNTNRYVIEGYTTWYEAVKKISPPDDKEVKYTSPLDDNSQSRGEISGNQGVKPTSPKPVLEPSVNTNTLSEPVGTETAIPVSKIIPDVLEQAEEVIEAKAKKERKPNPNFDAVCKYVFDTNPDSVGEDGGRVGPIAQWLNGKSDGLKRAGGKVGFISRPAEPEHVRQFAEWWKRVKKCSLPREFIKFVEAWREWATKAHKPVNTSSDPAQNLSIAVPVVPMLMQKRTEELEAVV